MYRSSLPSPGGGLGARRPCSSQIIQRLSPMIGCNGAVLSLFIHLHLQKHLGKICRRPPRGVQMVDKHLAAGGGDATVHGRLLPLLAISEGVDRAERRGIGNLSLAKSERVPTGRSAECVQARFY